MNTNKNNGQKLEVGNDNQNGGQWEAVVDAWFAGLSAAERKLAHELHRIVNHVRRGLVVEVRQEGQELKSTVVYQFRPGVGRCGKGNPAWRWN